MPYRLIEPPVSLEFHTLSKAQARAYAEWFHSVLPERVAILADIVRQSPETEGWERSRTPQSLEPLGRWFANEVTVVSRSEDEIEYEKSKLVIPIEVSSTRLSDRTLSLCFDVGMYLSQVILKNVPGTAWSQDLAKSSMDYAQPVISGFGKAHLNPVRIATVTALKAARGLVSEAAALREVYDIWANMSTERGGPTMPTIVPETGGTPAGPRD